MPETALPYSCLTLLSPFNSCPRHRCFSAALPALCRAVSAQALWGFCCTQCSLCPCFSPAGWPHLPGPRSPASWQGHEGSDRSGKALPAAFPPSSEGQILSIAPTLKSLLLSTVTNRAGSELFVATSEEGGMHRAPQTSLSAAAPPAPAAELKLKKRFYSWSNEG